MKKMFIIIIFFTMLLSRADLLTSKKLQEIRSEKQDCLLVFMEGLESDSSVVNIAMEKQIKQLEEKYIVFTSFEKKNSSDFFIQEFPTILMIKNGVPVNSIIGLNKYEKVLKQISNILK